VLPMPFSRRSPAIPSARLPVGAVIGRGRFAAEIGMMAVLCLTVAGAILGLTVVLLAGQVG
jgi:hypothetical protein